MSALQQACEDYLALRRATGCVLNRHGRMLPDLVWHLEAAGLATITTSAALEWATRPAGHSQEWASRLSVTRGFARYLRTLDGIAEVPPTDLLPGCRRRLAPYLYSEEEVAALMAATATIYFPQRGATYRALIGLLAVTGMRIGEAIALDRDDVNLAAGVVTVRAGKFNAARELPVHDSTVALSTSTGRCATAAGRRRRCPRSSCRCAAHGFAPTTSAKRSATCAGTPASAPHRGPGSHGSMTCATASRSRRSSTGTAATPMSRPGCPRLSSYLGHAAPEATYYYLQATPQLLALAAERLERLETRS